RRPVLVAGGDVRVLAVLAAERRRRDAAGMLRSESWGYFIQSKKSGRGEREQRYLPIEHGEVDVAALAGARAYGERGEDGDRDPKPRGEVGDRQARLHRAAALLAGKAHQAAHRLEYGV